jgi:hypothetical protein
MQSFFHVFFAAEKKLRAGMQHILCIRILIHMVQLIKMVSRRAQGSTDDTSLLP